MTKEEFLSSKEGRKLTYEGIKNIELILENCEILIIPREAVGQIIIKDFESEFRRTAINSIDFVQIAKYVILQIHDVNSKCKCTNTLLYMQDDNLEEVNIFERLQGRDITQIQINYLWDEEVHQWTVDWQSEDENDTTNVLQTTEEYFGDTWLAIGEKAQKELKDILPSDKKERDFGWNIWK